MVFNELVFFLHSFCLSLITVIAARIGKECLIALIALFTVLSNAFIIKETTLFGLTATCTDSFTIAATIALNVLHQQYGYEYAQKTVKISFFCLIIYMVASQFQLAYSMTVSSMTNQAFETILSTSPRIVFASLFSFYISQSLDCKIYKWLLGNQKFAFFRLKNGISAALSQLVDTTLFSYLGLYGIINAIPHIIVISYIVKIIALIFALLLIRIFKKFSILAYEP